MIQRIQSIYLALAAIFSVFPFFVPLVLFTDENKWISMNNIGYDGSQVAEMAGRHPYGLAVWGIVVVILPLISIFAFKNRKKQIRWANWAMAANILWYVALASYAFSVKSRTNTDLHFEMGCLFPLVSLITLFLAKKAIKHDEALVKAADRIR